MRCRWPTLTAHGKTMKAYATLKQDFNVDNMVMASETGALGELQFNGIIVYDLNQPGECNEITRAATDSPIPEIIGQHARIVQVGARFFLLRVSPGEFQALSLNIWIPVF